MLRVAPYIVGAKLHAATRLVARFPGVLEAMWAVSFLAITRPGWWT